MSEAQYTDSRPRQSKDETKTGTSRHKLFARLRTASRTERLFGTSLIVLALHLAVLSIEGRNILGRAANPLISLLGIVLVPGLFALFLWRGRIVRTVLAAALALLAFFVGSAVSLPHFTFARATTSDGTGVLFLIAGVFLLILALWLGLHGSRRRTKLIMVPLLLCVIFQWVLVPAFDAAYATNAPKPASPSASTLGLAGARDVTFAARDGVRLVGWYVPGTNGAAVLVLHGSHSSRQDTLPHVRILAQAGYAVLSYNARGHGQSDGATSTLGWIEDDDIAGAVSWLAQQPGINPLRIAALGLSMGAMDALRAATSGIRLAAIIADGAVAGTFGDQAILDGQGVLAPITLSADWLGSRATELVSGTKEPPALVSIVGQIRVPVLLIASGEPGELTYGQVYRARIGANATLWFVPDAGHIQALSTHPQDYTARVTAFLEAALAQTAQHR